jgi:hypothetical protein
VAVSVETRESPAGRSRWRGGVRAALAQLERPFDARAPLPGRRELLVVAVALTAFAIALYLRHVVRGGWYYDDWALFSDAVLAPGTGPFAAADALLEHGYRPGFSLSLAALYAVGGTDPARYLAVGVALVALQVWIFYTALRVVGFKVAASGLAAALLLAVPAIDTTRLWVTAFPIWIALSLYMAGVAAAVMGLRAEARRPRIVWHATAMAFFAVATLTYELIVPLVVLSALLYLPHGGLRRAAPRWGLDLLAVGAPLAWMLPRAEDNRPIELTPDYVLDRVGEVVSSAWTVFLNLLPADRVIRGPLGVVLVIIVAVGIGVALSGRSQLSSTVRVWGLIGVGALAFALAGLLPLLPAEPYYILRWTGIGNRFGAVSSLGVVLLVMALCALAATGLAALVRRPAWMGALAAVGISVTLAQWIVQEARNQDAWAQSWRESERVMAAVRESLPARPPPSSAVVTFRHLTFILPADVPVFGASWDLNGAVRLAYRDPSLAAQPYGPATICSVEGVQLPSDTNAIATEGPNAVRGIVSYGRTWFVDVGETRAYLVEDRATCRRHLADLTAG